MFMSEMRKLEDPVRRVVIAGGGNIGVRLALALEQTNQVKIIERDTSARESISEQLNKAIVLVGDAADEELLLEENIDSVDVFCSVTNAEEANILSAMLAKRLGAHKVMALINRPSYAELVESGSIDIAISPQQVTIGSLLAHVRRGDVVKVHSLRRGAAEAIEAVAHGSEGTSPVVGQENRGHRAAARQRHRHDRPRRAGHHGASRHGDRNRRSRHHVPDRPAENRKHRETVPGRRIVCLTQPAETCMHATRRIG